MQFKYRRMQLIKALKVNAYRHSLIEGRADGGHGMPCLPTVGLIRPPDIVCRRTYILPVFPFFRQLVSEVAERN